MDMMDRMMEQAERCADAAIRLAFVDEFKFYPSEDEFELINRYRIDNGVTRLPVADTDDVMPPFLIRYQDTALGSIHVKMKYGISSYPVCFEAKCVPPETYVNDGVELIS